MSLKKYEVLLNSLESGSFSKTSENLGYTQSGVTHMMNSLESELGFKVLKRGKKGVSITKEGELILPAIREILRAAEKLQQIAAQIKGIEKGALVIGTFTSLLLNWVPDIIEIFQTKYPYITIKIMEGKLSELEKWLDDGTVDLCFFSRQQHHSYEYIELAKDSLLAVLPKNHALSHLETIPLEAFSKYPFLSNDADMDVANLLNLYHIQPKTTFSSNFYTAVIAMVKHNQGIAILPKLLCNFKNQKVIVRNISPTLERNIVISYRPNDEPTPSMNCFIGCVKSYFNLNRQPQHTK
ncbi:MAG: LysR family transcriptional regulator [Peptococcaceae bacterium]